MAERSQNEDSFDKVILSFSQGNQDSFGQLFDKYAPALLGVITRIVGNPELSADCLQHTFNEIWKEKSSYNYKKERIFTWMIKITRSCALCFLKNGHCSFDSAPGTMPGRQQVVDVKNESVSKSDNKPGSAASFVQADQQEILQLLYIEGFTYAETAARLNIPVETVKFKYILAIKNLKGKVAV